MARHGTAPSFGIGTSLVALLLLSLPGCKSDLKGTLSASVTTEPTAPNGTGDDAPEPDTADDDAPEPAADDTVVPSDDDTLEPQPGNDDVPDAGDDVAPEPEPEPVPSDDDVPEPVPSDDDVPEPVPSDDDVPEPDTAPNDDAPSDDDAPEPEPMAVDAGVPDSGELPPPGDDAGLPLDGGAPDLCPEDPAKVDPGACGCGTPDTDSDADGWVDCDEACPDDPLKIEPGLCDCGVPDTDRDSDGTPDCNDGCLDDPLKSAPGQCGCGESDQTGNDSVAECLDLAGALQHRYSFQGSGTTATDSVGDLDGDLIGTTLTGTGSVDLATGPHVNLPNALLDGLVNATFEVWLRRGSLTSAWQRVFDFGDSGVEDASNLGASYIFLTPRTTSDKGNAVRLTYYNGVATEVALTGAAILPLDTASHVAAVFDDAGNAMRLYVNGDLVAEGAWAEALSDINAINNWLGKSQYMADPGFDGSIDEFRIYDVALDEEQIEYSIAAGVAPEWLE
jgi:hypothetical protein